MGRSSACLSVGHKTNEPPTWVRHLFASPSLWQILKQPFMKSLCSWAEVCISAGRHINYALEICRLITEGRQWNAIKGAGSAGRRREDWAGGPNIYSKILILSGRKMQKVTQSKRRKGSPGDFGAFVSGWHCISQVAFIPFLWSL